MSARSDRRFSVGSTTSSSCRWSRLRSPSGASCGALFFILIDIIDFLFPILLQVMRFPLFTLRILGDGIAALLKGIVRLPAGRRRPPRGLARIHQPPLGVAAAKISYRAFEEWLHHAFESGMAWVFKTCRALTPRTALLVLIGAVLWLPISFASRP